jgi:hypothetical protein
VGESAAIMGAIVGSGGAVYGGVAVTSAVSDHLVRRVGRLSRTVQLAAVRPCLQG